jgi:hypothetical protein
VACDDEASASCVGCRGITQASSCITSTPLRARGLARASAPTGPIQAAGRRRQGFSPRSPHPRGGAGGTVDAAAAAVVPTAAASCRDPAATVVLRGGSVIVTALPAVRGSLDERRLVGTGASDLSALAGARAGTVGATLRTGTQDQALAPRNRGHLGRLPPTSS